MIRFEDFHRLDQHMTSQDPVLDLEKSIFDNIENIGQNSQINCVHFSGQTRTVLVLKDSFGVGGPNNTGFRATVAFGVNGLLSASILKVDLPIDSTKPGMCRFCCQRFIFMT
jgi:hypothetical protein